MTVSRRILIGAGCAVAALAGAAGGTVLAANGATSESRDISETRPAPSYAVNAHGETFGSAADASNREQEPDLIRAYATNGRLGYVRRTELEVADGTTAALSFTSPEQALAWQQERGGRSFPVPVYAEDGTTVVGEFLVLPGEVSNVVP